MNSIRANYYEEYLLVKHASAVYPEFNSLSEMEKEAVLKQLKGAYGATADAARGAYRTTADATREAYKATAKAARGGAAKVKRGAKATGDAYDYVGRRGAAWLESKDIPFTRAVQQAQTAGTVANASGPVAGAASLGTGIVLARKSAKAARRLRNRKRKFTPTRRDLRDRRTVALDSMLNESHLSSVANEAADSGAQVYNAPGRLTPASWMDYLPGM